MSEMMDIKEEHGTTSTSSSSSNCNNNNSQMMMIETMKDKLSKFETKHGRLYGLNEYIPHQNDIAITTTPKAGTTWTQQICHQIRSVGCGSNTSNNTTTTTTVTTNDNNSTSTTSSSNANNNKKDDDVCDNDRVIGCGMSFENEIGQVVPWIELAYDVGQNLDTPQYTYEHDERTLPRFFKTHCWYKHCPTFPKTIVVVRNPYDVLVSFYTFFEDWFFPKGSISFEDFASEFWLSRGIPDDSKMDNASYFIHLTSWYKQKYQPIRTSSPKIDATGDQNHDHADDDPIKVTDINEQILFVFYENLIENLEYEIQRIAQFVSNEYINYDQEYIIQEVTKRSTFQYMKRNEHKFDEKITKLARNGPCGLSPTAGMMASKIQQGGNSSIGNNNNNHNMKQSLLTDEIRQKIDTKWMEIVYPITKCESYDKLRKSITFHANNNNNNNNNK